MQPEYMPQNHKFTTLYAIKREKMSENEKNAVETEARQRFFKAYGDYG